MKAIPHINWIRYASLSALVWLIFDNPWTMININWTQSVPYHVVFVVKGMPANKGQYVAVKYEGPRIDSHYPSELFLKKIAGVEGDSVSLRTSTDGVTTAYLNEIPVGVIKRHTSLGTPLIPTHEGIIPAGQFYLMAPHADSFDSRYAQVGWPSSKQIVGRAIPLI